jgi:hypothetical protein
MLLYMILVVPFFVHKIYWVAGSRKTIGEMRYQGHGDLGSALGISSFPVIRFKLGLDTVYFDGNINLDLKPGQPVEIRYQKDNPPDAKINCFPCIWMDTIANALMPFLVLLILFLTPERFDPLIPRKSKIVLGQRPFVRILKNNQMGSSKI